MTHPLASRVALRFIKATSWGEALALLDFSPGDSPSDYEVQQAYRKKVTENRSMHPDLGGSTAEMAQLNAAKDTLLGNLKPDDGPSPSGYQGPSHPSGRPAPKAPEEVKVTFEQAQKKVTIPTGVEWFFVTETQYSGYNSDEFTKSSKGWVACGRLGGTKWVFVSAENHYYRAHMPGGYFSLNKEVKPMDVWVLDYLALDTAAETPTAAELYRGVEKVWRNFKYLDKAFNSKVVPAKGWAFGEKPPEGHSQTIKQLIANEFGGEFTGKMTVNVRHHEHYGLGDPPADYYKPKYHDAYSLEFIINGRSYRMDVPDIVRLEKLRIGGKGFVERVFGRYPGERPKSLTQNKDGKAIMQWMLDHLQLTPWVKDALAKTVQQLGGTKVALIERVFSRHTEAWL